ncbi:MAG TPA: SLBB domain-containing protein, partial [Gemmatimonadaceae bacterium]|nr:SLBB domain-containing protein [Gemmatimonadaceae bacterium]
MAALVGGERSIAQSVPSRQRFAFETRTELEAQAKLADAKADKGQAYLIRYRLEHGDFQDGDRIVISIRGAAGVNDTLTVRTGKRLELPQMADLSLDGVLRSELLPRLTAHVAKYLRDPVVRATPLVRVGILGTVVRPGFYYVSADLPLSDVLMSAGGPGAEADLEKVTVRRGSDVIVDASNTRVALTEGISLDMLHLRAGDEINVGKEKHFNWGVVVPSAAAILGLVITIT